MGSIGIKSSSSLHYQLRAADKVVSDLTQVSVEAVLKVIIGSYGKLEIQLFVNPSHTSFE